MNLREGTLQDRSVPGKRGSFPVRADRALVVTCACVSGGSLPAACTLLSTARGRRRPAAHCCSSLFVSMKTRVSDGDTKKRVQARSWNSQAKKMQTREGSRGTGTLPVASSDEHNSSTSYRKCPFTGFIRSIYFWLLPLFLLVFSKYFENY